MMTSAHFQHKRSVCGVHIVKGDDSERECVSTYTIEVSLSSFFCVFSKCLLFFLNFCSQSWISEGNPRWKI